MNASITDPLALAKQIGDTRYPQLGGTVFEELELCYASTLSPPFVNQKIRPFINLNLYWARGFFKNSIINDFQECLPSVAEYPIRNATSATIETMFGSISKDGRKLISPLFHSQKICFMPELLSFLGTNEGMKEKVNCFNEVLEGNEVTRDLIKFSNAKPELYDLYKEGDLVLKGNTLIYKPRTSFIVATRPLDNRNFTYLNESGFWSRFHTIQFNITEDMAASIFTSPVLSDSSIKVADLKSQLKLFNEALWLKRTEIKTNLTDVLLAPILEEAKKIGVQLYCQKDEADVSTVLNARIKDDIIREANAYKILYPAKTDNEVIEWAIGRLPHFFEFAVNPIISKDTTYYKHKSKLNCLIEIKNLIKGNPKKRIDIQDALQKQGYSRPTIDRCLGSLNDNGLNKSTKNGEYMI